LEGKKEKLFFLLGFPKTFYFFSSTTAVRRTARSGGKERKGVW
jgi:hypothetical protein